MAETRVGVKLVAEVWRETLSSCNHSPSSNLHPHGACITNRTICAVARVIFELVGKGHPELTRSAREVPVRVPADGLPVVGFTM